MGFFHPYCKEEESGGGAVSRRQDHDIHRGRRGRPQHDLDHGPGLVQREYQRLQVEVYLFIHTNRRIVNAYFYPHFTMLGQSLGSLVLMLFNI